MSENLETNFHETFLGRSAMFVFGDGSPGISVEQGLDESDEAFYQRLHSEQDSFGGYGVLQLISVEYSDTLMFSRYMRDRYNVDMPNLHAGRREMMRQKAAEAIKREYGDSWEEHRYSKFIDSETGEWIASEGTRNEHETCPWPNIQHVIDVIIDAVIDAESEAL